MRFHLQVEYDSIPNYKMQTKGGISMNKEIDVRALIMNNITSEYMVENCSSFVKYDGKIDEGLFCEKLVFRNFNADMWWSSGRQTAFIESIYMGCELPLIIIFEISENPLKYLVIDGLNRILTIQNFMNDKLKLSSKYLKKAAFLENNYFSDLSDDERNYFCGRGIQILKYSYTNKSHKLTEEEIDEIAKQLYIRYNSGIKLKNEEIQKATYEDDLLTQRLNLKLKNPEILNKLKNIYFTPLKNTKTFIESTLMYSRLAITSCFAPLSLFCKKKSILEKIDCFYKDYTLEINKEVILDDFFDIVSCLYELTQQSYWNEHLKLHNQSFMLVTYWLLFNIKKHGLIPLNQFNWKKYISYFGKQEEQKPLFSTFQVNAKEKYNAIINYMLEFYNIDLNKYLVNENKNIRTGKVTTFEQLPKYNFQLARDGITISTLLNQLKDEAFILRPSYQRREINDIRASSFLIESLALSMPMPDILVYRHETDTNKTIFEVVDGQQRAFTLLGFFNKKYTNFLGEETSSEKEGFSLQGLTLCTDLNNKKINGLKNTLNKNYVEKILNAKTRIVYIPEKENPYFSVKDYFTNINKTIIPLKRTTYRYWNAYFDSKLIKMVEHIASEFAGTILPKSDNKYLPQQFVMNLAYLFFHKQTDPKKFSVQGVANWVKDFNQKKYTFINLAHEEKVEPLRQKYIVAFDQVELFLTKMTNWLSTEKHTMNDLIAKKTKKVPFTDLLCLYYLLGEIDQPDLLNNSDHIYDIVSEYFENGAKNNLKREERIATIGKYKDRLSLYSTRTVERQQFREKITAVMNKD